MSEIIESYSREEEIKLFATPIELDLGYEVFVEINLLDKDKNILKTITPKGVKVEKNPNKNKYGDSEEIIIYKFVINELAKDINPKDVKFVTGWIDANDDKEINILYNELSILKVSECYCYRDFTVDEVKNIVKELRDSEEDTKGKYSLFTAYNCKLPQSERTYERFTEELNKTFRKYEINTCLRKIHFLAQAYHETAYFQTNKEKGSEQYLKNKPYYPYYGRGLMQITWFNLYEKYFYHLQSDDVKTNYEIIETRLALSFDSAGWFWQQGKILGTANTNLWKAPSFKGLVGEAVEKENPSSIKVVRTYGKNKNKYGTLDLNKLANNDWIDTISWLVNGGANGFFERRKYLKKLKEIMKYEDCSKNK